MDLDGKVIRSAEVDGLNMDRLDSILMDFKGKIMQLPPMHSALKYKGRPLYKFARMGIDIKRRPREIEISGIEVIENKKDTATLKIGCSSGTYIRSLANDIGKAYGTGAVLAGLIRTAIGTFNIRMAKTTEEILDMARCDKIKDGSDSIISLQGLFKENPSIYINRDSEKKVLNGSPLRADMIDTGCKSLFEIAEELKNAGTRSDAVLSVRTSRGSMLALHELAEGASIENIQSLDRDFTKSIVIF